MPIVPPFQPAVALAQLFKLLAEPNRVRILGALGMDCRPVSDLIAATELEQTNASFHLRVLREAGLIRAERRGRFIYYCLSDPRLLGMVSPLSAWLAERVGDAKAVPKSNGERKATSSKACAPNIARSGQRTGREPGKGNRA